MNCSRKPLIFSALLGALVILSGCGVKGDPLPPERPPRLGRGRPTYQKATQKLKIESTKDGDDDEKH